MSTTKKVKADERQTTASATTILRRVAGRGVSMQDLLQRERLNALVARRICEARTKRHLSQAKFAAMIGTTQSVIARLEDADYDGHSLRMFRRIAEALDYDIDVRFHSRVRRATDR